MTKVYMFFNQQYLRYDRGNDRADEGYPLSIGDHWPGFSAAGFDTGVDAGIDWGNGKAYFFKGSQYLRYDIAQDKVEDGYPLPIGGQWPGFTEAGFDSGIDTCINWGDGNAYFFKGDKYLRYNIAQDKVDAGYPLNTAEFWPGFGPAGFGSNIDAMIDWGDGKVYVFKGPNYLRFDKADNRVDDGYPLTIAGRWPGVGEAGFTNGITAIVGLMPAGEIWLPTATVIRAPVNGPKYIDLPWRGVLHTTEGGTADGAISTFRGNNFWSHLVIEPNTRKIFQHIPLNIGARAMGDHPTPENAAHAVQIEIVGFAQNSPNIAPEQLDFVRDVMRQIEEVVPIPRSTDRTFLDFAGVNATPNNRMSVAEWKRFSGWCGHQHVPGDTHWDPGAIDIATLLS
jgi:hypothetical protein